MQRYAVKPELNSRVHRKRLKNGYNKFLLGVIAGKKLRNLSAAKLQNNYKNFLDSVLDGYRERAMGLMPYSTLEYISNTICTEHTLYSYSMMYDMM
jgi:hypothetical protein